MRLVDFLIHILESHAQTLQRLAALFSEDIFFEMLEHSAEDDDKSAAPAPPGKGLRLWADGSHVRGVGAQASAYSELEAAVKSWKLSPPLEFHLWAYPHYRTFIQSSLDLNSHIQEPDEKNADALIEEAVAAARAWARKLPVPPEYGQQMETAAQVPWLRFRTTVLKRIGKRPLREYRPRDDD